jgi:hypothetical protein
MNSYESFNNHVALVEELAPSDEIPGIQGQTARDIAEKYVQMSDSFPELVNNLKKAEQTEKDRNVAQIIFRVRMRAENLLANQVNRAMV